MDGCYAAAGKQINILIGEPYAVGCQRTGIPNVINIQQLCRSQTILLQTGFLLVLRFGNVDLHANAGADGILRQRMPDLIKGGVLRMDGITLRSREITTLEQIKIIVTHRPIPMPLNSVVVIAMVEHMPSSWTNTGF